MALALRAASFLVVFGLSVGLGRTSSPPPVVAEGEGAALRHSTPGPGEGRVLRGAPAASGSCSPAVLRFPCTFEAFVREFQKKYVPGTSEYEQRHAIFEDALESVLTHNAETGQTYWRAINQFSDMTAAEFRGRLGYNKGQRNRSRSAMPARGRSREQKLPASFDWRERGVITAVKNQGHCGSCWAFATTETVESHAAIRSQGVLSVLSPQQLVSCAPNPQHCGGTGGCQGATADVAIEYIAAHGMTTEWVYPYTAFFGEAGNCTDMYKKNAQLFKTVTIDSYEKLPENEYEAVMHALVEEGPLIVSVQANTWHDYGGGIADPCTDMSNIDINHAVQLVGYGAENGTDYWLVRNSWEATWGEKGYIRLKRSSTLACGLDVTPAHGNACENDMPWNQTVCGTCGILFDASYPVGAAVVGIASGDVNR